MDTANTINGFKVIRRSNRGSVSTLWCKKFPMALDYPINQEVFPKNNSKIFLFANRSEAEWFISLLHPEYLKDVMIVPCIATNPSKPKEVTDLAKEVSNFWDKTISKNDLSEPIRGTLWADSVTCLE